MKVGERFLPLREREIFLELTATLEIRFWLLLAPSIAVLLSNPISQTLRISRHYASIRLRGGLALTNRTY